MYFNTKQSNALILLCFCVYTAGYIGRLNYNASLVEILSAFGASKAEGGLVSSFFFFAYGLGQLVNGILSKRYNPRVMLTLSLVLSSLINMTMPFMGTLAMMKWLWLVNGFSQSILWSTIIKTLSQHVPDDMLSKAILVMSATVAIGTFCAYGLSALCIALGSWRMVFYIAAAVLFVVAATWFVGFGMLKKRAQADSTGLLPRQNTDGAKLGSSIRQRLSLSGLFILILSGALILSVANGFIKDGTVTWIPSILYEEFLLDKAFSIILAFFIPLLSIFGAILASKLHKRIKGFHILIGIFYAVSLVCFILFLSVSLPNRLLLMTILIFIINSCCMSAINNILTSMIPLYYREKVKSGIAAGVINTFCYVGSTLSSIILGVIADNRGWTSVFLFLLTVSAAAVFLSLLTMIADRAEEKRKDKEERNAG